jgi:hypothetical protein
MLAAGELPAAPLTPVTAYLEHERWGVLPYAGGTFDQPADLLAEMSIVKAIVETRRHERQKAELEQQARRRGRR